MGLVDRFWAKVDRSQLSPGGCWTWTAGTCGSGYGSFQGPHRTLNAHRVAWEIENGPIPKGDGHHGTCVCHRCDNKLCCNPAHLFLGSNAANMADKAQKGRQARGERSGNVKLDTDKVKAIRACYATGCFSQASLAEQFGISTTQIHSVVNRKSWRHV